MEQQGEAKTIKSDETLFAIVESLYELDGATLTELASHLGLAKSTVHGHLATLKAHEYAVREDDEYHLGLGFLELGAHAKNRYKLTEVAQPTIEKLAEATGECVWIVVEEHGRAVYLCQATGENSVQTHVRVGKRYYLHHLATGKAILAHMPRERVAAIVDRHGLPAFTENTITDEKALFAELDAVRERGFAVNDGETIRGLRAIGVPIMREDEVVAGLCVSGPANRLRDVHSNEELMDGLLGTANEIELKLVFS